MRGGASIDLHPARRVVAREAHGRATPDGYPADDGFYTSSNAMLQRWQMASKTEWPLTSLVPNPWRYGEVIPEKDWMAMVIDVIAVRLTGHVLGEASHQSAIDLLQSNSGNRSDKVRMLGQFIARLPEVSLH